MAAMVAVIIIVLSIGPEQEGRASQRLAKIAQARGGFNRYESVPALPGSGQLSAVNEVWCSIA
jgi:hypothetical protein